MIINKSIEISWQRKNVGHYKNLGYHYTKIGDYFMCKVEDLPKNSHVKIKISCDYCNAPFEVSYYAYTASKDKYIIKKDCCNKCKYIKIKECNMLNYGETHPVKLKENREHLSKIKRHSIEFVKGEFEKENCLLMTSAYKNSKTILEFICNNHEDVIIQTTSFRHWNSGHKCKLCTYENKRGEGNVNYKGGMTSLNKYLRDQLIDWKKLSMKACNYRCVITNEKIRHDFVIHHLYGFNTIVDTAIRQYHFPIHANIDMYSNKELRMIKTIIKDQHERLLGACLKPYVHNLFHKEYGKGNNTIEQFEEFKVRYLKGEFNQQPDQTAS